jgi:hypothetical protein
MTLTLKPIKPKRISDRDSQSRPQRAFIAMKRHISYVIYFVKGI